MKLILYFVCVPGFILMMTDCQQTSKPDTETATVDTAVVDTAAAEEQPLPFNTTSNRYFRNAKEAYRQGDLNRAAKDIRQGADAWYRETPSTDTLEQARDHMLSKVRELADQTEAGEVYSINHLNDTFSEAELLCARLELEKSMNLISEEQYEPATQQGKQAITRIDEMLTYTERTIEQDTRRLLDETLAMLNEIKQDETIAPDTLRMKLNAVQVALSTMVEPADVVQNTDTTYQTNP